MDTKKRTNLSGVEVPGGVGASCGVCPWVVMGEYNSPWLISKGPSPEAPSRSMRSYAALGVPCPDPLNDDGSSFSTPLLCDPGIGTTALLLPASLVHDKSEQQEVRP